MGLVGGFAPAMINPAQWVGKCPADSPKDSNHRCGMWRHARLKVCAKEVDQQDCCMTLLSFFTSTVGTLFQDISTRFTLNHGRNPPLVIYWIVHLHI